MKLHKDREAFGALLFGISQTHGIRADILEKDYYVVLILRELAEKQSTLPAFSKAAQHCTRRCTA